MAHDQETNSKTPILDQPWSSVPEVVSLYCILAWALMDANHSMQHADRQLLRRKRRQVNESRGIGGSSKGLLSRYRHDTGKSQLA